MKIIKRTILSIFVLVLALFIIGCKAEEVVNVYTVTYYLNGDEYSKVEYKSNEDVELEYIEESGGLLFDGWYKDPNLKSKFTDKRIKSDMNLYGSYIEGLFRVNFVTGTDVVIEERIIAKGEKVGSVPTLTRDGYEFKGWFRDEACVAPFDIENDTVAGTLTLYAGWEEILPVYINIYFRSLTDGIYAGKDDLYVAYYTAFYNFMKEHTEANLEETTLEDFLVQGKTWKMPGGRAEMYHMGDQYGRYYVKSQKGGTLEEQPETSFLGYCYKNGMFIDFIHHLETFFEYWRTDEGYTGSDADPNNTGNDFYIEPWASMVDTAKFFYFTADTLQDTYKWFDSERVKDALDNIPGVLAGLSAKKVELGHEFDLSTISIEGYDLEFFVDEAGTAKIDKLTEVHTSCDECSYIEVYVKVTKK